MTSVSAHKHIDSSALTDARSDEELPARAARAQREAPAADRADHELSVPLELAAATPAWSPGLSRLAAGLGIFFGLTGLLQWTIFPSLLIERSSVWPVLKPNVSACVLLTGVAAMLLNRQPLPRVLALIARACALAVVLIGFSDIAQDFLGIDLGTDGWLSRSSGIVNPALPPRMTVTVALSYVLIGTSLWLLDLRPRWAQACIFGAALIALFALATNLFGVDLDVGGAGHAVMRPHVATVVLMLCFATLLARPPHGLVGILVSRSSAGAAARRLLPSFGLLLLGVGWLTLLGVRAGYYDAEFGLVLFGSMSIVCLLVLVGWHASLLLRMDVARGEAEAKIRMSEERFVKVLESAPTAMIMVDRGGRIALANACAAQLFGYSGDELMGRGVDSLFPAGPGAAGGNGATVAQRMLEGKARHVSGVHKGGEEIPVQVDANAIETAAGVRTLLTFVDMSSLARTVLDREAHQRQLEAALREKTVLLNEVHHRVKNNLQVIASLLFLQARYTPNPEVKAAFEESQSRVKAMALIHQLLYESKDFSRVRIADYLRRLGQLLAGTYGRRGERIRLHVEADDVFIDLTRAIPCGLLVNELVFNSFKYAFPDSRPGEIFIGLRHDPADGMARLLVRDNGVGLPPGVDPRTAKTLGLQLVWQLAEQIGATVCVGEGPGTSFEMQFYLSGNDSGDEPGENSRR